MAPVHPGGSDGSVAHAAGLCLYELPLPKATPATASGLTTLQSRGVGTTERRVPSGSTKGGALLAYLTWDETDGHLPTEQWEALPLPGHRR